MVTKDETTLVETVAVDGTAWVDMTGKIRLFETDATAPTVEGTVVTVALLLCLVDERLVPKERTIPTEILLIIYKFHDKY